MTIAAATANVNEGASMKSAEEDQITLKDSNLRSLAGGTGLAIT
jgi:hypothetical protein